MLRERECKCNPENAAPTCEGPEREEADCKAATECSSWGKR